MKTTLTIDGNYLLYKDVFILYEMKTLHQDLEKLLKMDVNKLLKLYPFDKIYFVSDSRHDSWRKSFYPPYKTGRVKDERIDWQWIYEQYDKVKDELKSNPRINVIEINSAEGDDLIAHIVNEGNNLGHSNFIVASDSDLHQFLKFNLSEKYINITYNFRYSDERLYLPENYNVYFSEMKRSANNTLFNMTDDDEYLMFLEELINKTKVVEVNNEKLLFTKIVSGDKKDTISSVYETHTTTNKVRGIGKTGAETIYNLYKETYNTEIDFDSDDFINKSTEIITFYKKIDNDLIKNNIKNSIIRNRKLIRLTDNYLPRQLLSTLNEKIQIK